MLDWPLEVWVRNFWASELCWTLLPEVVDLSFWSKNSDSKAWSTFQIKTPILVRFEKNYVCYALLEKNSHRLWFRWSTPTNLQLLNQSTSFHPISLGPHTLLFCDSSCFSLDRCCACCPKTLAVGSTHIFRCHYCGGIQAMRCRSHFSATSELCCWLRQQLDGLLGGFGPRLLFLLSHSFMFAKSSPEERFNSVRQGLGGVVGRQESRKHFFFRVPTYQQNEQQHNFLRRLVEKVWEQRRTSLARLARAWLQRDGA